MLHCFAVISVLWPIDSFVRGSFTPGATGLNIEGRRPSQGFSRSPKLRPRALASRTSAYSSG